MEPMTKTELEKNPFSGAVFVFRNRRGTALELLCYDGSGYWLVTTGFQRGAFDGGRTPKTRPYAPLSSTPFCSSL
jgi:transposase